MGEMMRSQLIPASSLESVSTSSVSSFSPSLTTNSGFFPQGSVSKGYLLIR